MLQQACTAPPSTAICFFSADLTLHLQASEQQHGMPHLTAARLTGTEFNLGAPCVSSITTWLTSTGKATAAVRRWGSHTVVLKCQKERSHADLALLKLDAVRFGPGFNQHHSSVSCPWQHIKAPHFSLNLQHSAANPDVPGMSCLPRR